MSGKRQGRGARQKARANKAEAGFDAAWRNWVNPYAPVEQFSVDQIEAIHLASLKVLSEVGIKVISPDAIAHYKAAGMTIKGDVVHFDPEILLDLIAKAPSEVTMHARGNGRDVTVGNGKVGVATTAGTPNYSDLQRGREPGCLARFDDFCRLSQSFDVIHIVGPFVEPQDVGTNLRHLEMTRSALSLTEKVPFVYFRGTEAVADAYEMIRIANGISEAEFRAKPYSFSVANSNSPMMLDDLMCRGIIDAAEAGQMMILTPFTLSGAMAPVTITGALVAQNAEALAGLSLSQIVRPGAPVCYGSFTSKVDMRTGAPAFGTPEYAKAAFASGQLARRYGLPLRSSGVTASNAVDAQAAYETQMSMWSALMGGTNFLLHGAGWLEGGLTASAEKFIIDIEMLQMFAELFKPLTTDVDALALDAIREVGHGGHFFGTEHTLARFETAFYSPLVSDWNNFETWSEQGAADATMRANRIYRETIERFEAPAMDEARREELDAFVERRTREGGADISR